MDSSCGGGNARVLEAVQALKADDPARFGVIMSSAHASSLRDDFEASREQVNQQVEVTCEEGALSGPGLRALALAVAMLSYAQSGGPTRWQNPYWTAFRRPYRSRNVPYFRPEAPR